MKKLYESAKFFYISPDKVKVHEDRVRRDFSPEKLEPLKQSIMLRGQLNPILLDDDYYVIAGECRLRACKDIAWEVLCVLASNLTELEKLELEIHENIARSDLSPVEECLGFYRLHEARKEDAALKGINWAYGDTAQLTGMSKTNVYDCIIMGECIRKAPMIFLDCKTKQEIKKKIQSVERQNEWLNLQNKAAKFVAAAEQGIGDKGVGILYPDLFKEPPAESDAAFEERLAAEREEIFAANPELRAVWENATSDAPPETRPPELLDEPDEEREPTPEEQIKRDQEILQAKIKAWDLQLGVGDAYQAFARMKPACVNVLLLDPPWGLGLHEKVEDELLEGKAYDDSEQEFLLNFPTLAKIAYEKMSEDSHLYCFFKIRSLEFVYGILEDAGFKVNWRPIIMIKQGVKSTRSPHYWPGATYEPIAFARKGKRKFVSDAPPDSFTIDWHRGTDKLQHPSAKPPSAYMQLLARSAYPGDIVVDPMYGSGAAFVACELLPQLHLRWYGWDIDPENKAKALFNLTTRVLSLDSNLEEIKQ